MLKHLIIFFVSTWAFAGGNAGLPPIEVPSGTTFKWLPSGMQTTGVVIGTSGVASIVAPGTSGNVLTSNGTTWASSASGGGGAADSVLTKTTSYTVLTSDFNSNKKLMLECNCSADCNITFPAASNSGYELDLINIGTATCTGVLAGSDTYGSTTDTTWGLPPGGSPQPSNIFKANGGTRWNGF